MGGLPVTATLYTLEDARRILNNPIKDRAYQQTRLGAAVTEYLAWRKKGRAAERTLDQYERDLARLCGELPDADPADIGIQELLLFFELFPPGSWNRVRSALSGFFKWCVLTDRCQRNPVDLMPRLRAESKKVYDIFEPAERQALVHAQDESLLPARDRLGALIFQNLGVRKSEALGMQPRHFDTFGRVVTVIGKGNKQRIVPFDDEVFLALQEFMATVIPSVRNVDDEGVWYEDRLPTPTDYIFFPCGATGEKPDGSRTPQLLWTKPHKPMSQSAMTRWWVRTVKRSGIRYRSLHMNRHTVGTELVEADVDSFTVKDWLGHADLRTTEVYVHNSRARMRRAASRLAEYRKGQEG